MSLIDILKPEQVEVYLQGFNAAFSDTKDDVVTVNEDPVWCAGYGEGLRHAINMAVNGITVLDVENDREHQMRLPFGKGFEPVTGTDPRD
jgi:hypothetical protein